MGFIAAERFILEKSFATKWSLLGNAYPLIIHMVLCYIALFHQQAALKAPPIHTRSFLERGSEYGCVFIPLECYRLITVLAWQGLLEQFPLENKWYQCTLTLNCSTPASLSFAVSMQSSISAYVFGFAGSLLPLPLYLSISTLYSQAVAFPTTFKF